MSAISRREVLKQARPRYGGRGKAGRSRLLDEICSLCGYERKYASKLLRGRRPIAGESGRRRGGSQRIYAAVEREVIKAIWLSAEQPCGKRLKAALPLWLPFYQKRHGQLDRKVKAKVLAASAATIDRLLAPCRITLGSRGRCGTRPGTLLRSQIPIRTIAQQRRINQLEREIVRESNYDARQVAKGLGETTFVSLQREAIDWKRFGNAKQIGSYIGCCPCEFSTGPNQRLGRIDRMGNRRMRTLLVEAVWRLKKWNPTWRGFKKFPHVFGSRATVRGATRKKAVVACARLLAIDLWRLQTGRVTLKDLGLKPAQA